MTDSRPFAGWSAIVGSLLDGRDLDAASADAAVTEILNGAATPSQMAAFLVALRAKGETAVELEAMLAAVRRASVTVSLPEAVAARAIDIVGTGGDKSNSVNVSTMSALVVAASGVPVCKHGNRASSSTCGSADVLEAAGVAIDLDPNGVQRCVEETGFGFCLAAKFHPAFRHVGPTRREIGVPTVFNLLGPMANPAPISFMLVGVAQAHMMEKMAHALISRGVTRAWIVNGHHGLDELSVSGPNSVCDIREGKITMMTLDSAEYGIARSDISDIVGGDATANMDTMKLVFAGQAGPVRDIVSFNSASALFVAGYANSIEEGVRIAHETLDSGAAASTLAKVVEVSQREKSRMESGS
ncbi:MAG: anthranilate phosphoribosyltransferase [Actinomycetota bacterium]|jgi:anthranilate phosphoribosyltransferase